MLHTIICNKEYGFGILVLHLILQEVLDLQNPRCLTDALYRHQTREKLPNGNPKIDEVDIQMIVQEAIAAGLWIISKCKPTA